MSRIVKNDFEVLKEYLCSYNLKELTDSNEGLSTFQNIHKFLFGIIALVSELEDKVLSKNNYDDVPKDDLIEQFSFLKECISDLISSFFISFHGAYKVAEFILRSSVEMFLRGMYYIEVPSIKAEKNLYKLFDAIKIAPSLNANELVKNHFDEIHQLYSDLCNYAHTSSKLHMDEIWSLNIFPKYHKEKLQKYKNNFTRLTRNYIFIICNRFKDDFHNIYFENKQTILECLSKNEKKFLMGNID